MQDRKEMTPEATIAFLKKANDAYWGIEGAIRQQQVIMGQLMETKEDIALIVRSLREVYPEQMGSLISAPPGAEQPESLEIERESVQIMK